MFCCLLLVVVVFCLFGIFVLYFRYSDYHYVLLIIYLNLFCYHLVFIYILLVVTGPLWKTAILCKCLLSRANLAVFLK